MNLTTLPWLVVVATNVAITLQRALILKLERTLLSLILVYKWADHFIWIDNGLMIKGTTPIGRATCVRLDVNDEFHNQGFIQESRQLWIQAGWHPPQDDPCQQWHPRKPEKPIAPHT
jgi:hypothetical protein